MSTNDIYERKIKIKNMIENLINDGKLDEAKESIKNYEKVVSNDIDIISMKAVIAILENRLDDADRVLNAGIEIEPKNFDLLFNLAYVYEQLGYYNESIRYYNEAKINTKSKEMMKEINSNILQIKDLHGDLIVENRKKISFFVKEKMDSFLPEIIKGLREEYEIRKIIVKDYNQIDEGMEWADICWFEWCDELIYHGSNLNIAKDKIIICRLHSYEAFTDLPSLVDWQSVDMLICVSEHIRNYVINKFRLPLNKIIVISNGVETDKFTFKKRTDGFKIAYAGYLNYKKGPMLLIHSFKKIYDMDNRFQLYIAGTFQDDRDLLYFNQMIDEWNLADNIHYEGWQNDLNSWLEDKNYIICTSLLESQNISVMQAMSKGIKPLIHNFVGAKSIYPNHLVWNTIEEVVNIINDESYSSEDYRNFVVSNYEVKRQIEKVSDALKNAQQNTNKIIKASKRFNRKPMVTVGVINYNYERYLDDCLKSILNQTYDNIEILVVDDCSTDLSKKKIKSYENINENIKGIYHDENSGSEAQAWNDIINNAKGEYFLILSADDYLASNVAIEEYVYELIRSGKDYVYSNLALVDDNKQHIDTWRYRQFNDEEIIKNTFNQLGAGVLPISVGMYRIGFFREKNMEYMKKDGVFVGIDTLNALRFVKEGLKYEYLNQTLICYRRHNNNNSLNISSRIIGITNILEFIVNNFDEHIYLEFNPNLVDADEIEANNNFLIGLKYYELLSKYRTLISEKESHLIDGSDSTRYNDPFSIVENKIKQYLEKSIKNSNLYCKEVNLLIEEMNLKF